MSDEQNLDQEDAPFLASVVYDDAHQCSGVLVDNLHILTTASCLIRTKTFDSTGQGIQPENIRIVLGTNSRYIKGITEDYINAEVKLASKWIAHPSYVQQEFNNHGPFEGNDVVIIAMTEPVLLSSRIWPVCLASSKSGSHQNSFLLGTSNCYVMCALCCAQGR